MEDKANPEVGKRGPKTVRTPELIAALLEGFEKLGTFAAASGYAEISDTTAHRWYDEDEELREEIALARAKYCGRHALAREAKIETAEQHERALQIVARGEYMPVNRTELTGKDGAALAPFTMNDAPATTPAQEAKP